MTTTLCLRYIEPKHWTSRYGGLGWKFKVQLFELVAESKLPTVTSSAAGMDLHIHYLCCLEWLETDQSLWSYHTMTKCPQWKKAFGTHWLCQHPLHGPWCCWLVGRAGQKDADINWGRYCRFIVAHQRACDQGLGLKRTLLQSHN